MVTMRTAALFLFVGLAQAGIDLFEAEEDLWPNGVEYALEAPAAEVHLVLAFRSGLGTLGERNTAALASAHFVVEYNDADRQTCYWNQYRPLPFDADSNPEWAGDDDAPGLFVTEGASAELTERTLVIRLPRVNRWRVRVTPLYGDTENVRRVPTLVQVAEVRDGKPRDFEELDPLLPWEEVEVPAEAEEAEPLPEGTEEPLLEEPREEPVAWTTLESVGGTTIRAIRSGSVPRGNVYRDANNAARRRVPGKSRARGVTDPVMQPLPALQPMPKPIAFPEPVPGAPVAGTIPPWGAPRPFWDVPKPRAARPSSPRAPRHR
jgi:hypothetical protein